jgi:hypothetical protein
VNGNGICGGAHLEKEGMWRTLEDFERARIGARQGWMGSGRKDKNQRGRKEVLGEGRRQFGRGVCWCECPSERVRQCGEKM